MSYAFVQDIAASWERYQPIADAIGQRVPAGLILHVAGRTDEGFRIIALWESKADWERFRDDRLALGGAAAHGPSSPPTSFRALRAEHIVVGNPRPVTPRQDHEEQSCLDHAVPSHHSGSRSRP